MKQRLHIGTYTEGGLHFPHGNVADSRGIYTALFDTETGSIEEMQLAAETSNPSFLAWHPEHPILYSVNETTIEGYRGGGLSVFRCGNEGRLDFCRRFDTLGGAPCHIAVEPQGRFLVVSNYRGGNFALFSLGSDGIPSDPPELFQSSGSGPNTQRQHGPHAHFATLDPLTRELLMVDLGTDTIYVRAWDLRSKTFSGDSRRDLKVPPGSGCRHLAFSPDGSALYAVGELDGSVGVFLRGTDRHFEGPVQVVSCRLRRSEEGETATASAIVMHRSGNRLYVSLRGEGGIAVFSVDADSRFLDKIQFQETDCMLPRFCGLTPENDRFIVCGQDTASIRTYRLDSFGKLASLESSTSVDSPVCLAWHPS